MKSTDRKRETPVERGAKAGFDRASGEVHGSGAGAGSSGNEAEEYDRSPDRAGGGR